jgi:hypothetical protein
MKTVTAVANGFYHLNNKHKNANSAIYVSGIMGTAAAKLVYPKTDGTYADFQDGALTLGDQVQLKHGVGMQVYVEISGSNAATNIEFKCAGVD